MYTFSTNSQKISSWLSLSQQLFTEITFMKRYDGFYVVGHESVVPKNLVYAFSFIRNGGLSEHNNAGT